MARTKPTGWVGWAYFASVMMVLVGGLQAISGLVALFKEEFFLVTDEALIAFNYTAWGWIQIVLGALLVVAALAVMMGNAWGRLAGVLLAVLSAVASLAFLAAFPTWAVITIAGNVLVIYALAMHGAENRS